MQYFYTLCTADAHLGSLTALVPEVCSISSALPEAKPVVRIDFLSFVLSHRVENVQSSEQRSSERFSPETFTDSAVGPKAVGSTPNAPPLCSQVMLFDDSTLVAAPPATPEAHLNI